MLKRKYMFTNVKDFQILFYSLCIRKNLKDRLTTTLKSYAETSEQYYNIT
jgi:hypothetical protein